MNRKIKRIAKGVLIGVGLMLATLFVAIFVLLYFFLFGGPAKITRNIKDYGEVLNHPDVQTAYIVFPEELPEGTLETEFYSSYRATFASPTLETYLKCVYDDESYWKEIYRLENTSKKYANRELKLLQDPEEKFKYPAYIAVENAGHKYEYALLTGENEITYINTAYIDRRHVHFPEEYLPYDFMTEEGRAFGSGYSIYYASITGTMIDIDYTRDPVTEVSDSHIKILDDTHFMVRVTLDKQGREIISECVTYTLDTSNFLEGEEPEETVYDDLNGMEYKDMELDRESGVVSILYEDEGVEKSKKYYISQKY